MTAPGSPPGSFPASPPGTAPQRETAPEPTTAELARRWGLEPGLAFLNHGSFGACPTEVLEYQRSLRDRMERDPVRFFVHDFERVMDKARGAVATFVRAPAGDVAFVPNATVAANAVLRSLRFEPGDELLATDHEYNACMNILRHVAERDGARVVVATVPYPSAGADEVHAAITARVTDRTRLALVSHVTSPTGLIWPIERLVTDLRDRGVDVLVDGAHGPGMLDLDLGALGAAYYIGNWHKWVCAPKGAGLLYVRPDKQQGITPAIISHGANSPRTDRPRFRLEADWTGTMDITAYLSVPAAIRVVGDMLPGGWPAVRARNRAMALEGRRIVCERLGIEPPAPEPMFGSLATIPLPDATTPPPATALYADPLQMALYDEFRVQVPIVPWPEHPKRLVRLSAQLYNGRGDYERLAEGLAALL